MTVAARRRLYLWCALGGAAILMAALLAGLVPAGPGVIGYWAIIGFLFACGAALMIDRVPIGVVERTAYVVVAGFWFYMMAVGLFTTDDAQRAWLSMSPTVIMGLNLQVVMAYLWFDTTVALWNALALPVVSSVVGGIYFAAHPGVNGEIMSDFVRFEVSLFVAVGFVHILARSKDILAITRVEAARMRELAYRDALTGLPNRRAALDELAQRAEGNGRSTVMILDVDDFKQVNDSLGHEAGDLVLIRLAELLREQAAGWVLARWGGEEFLVVIDGSPDNGLIGAEHLRQAVERSTFPGGVRITVSIGLAYLDGPSDAPTVQVRETLRLADLQLYRAKGEGRNRVRAHGDGVQRA